MSDVIAKVLADDGTTVPADVLKLSNSPQNIVNINPSNILRLSTIKHILFCRNYENVLFPCHGYATHEYVDNGRKFYIGMYQSINVSNDDTMEYTVTGDPNVWILDDEIRDILTTDAPIVLKKDCMIKSFVQNKDGPRKSHTEIGNGIESNYQREPMGLMYGGSRNRSKKSRKTVRRRKASRRKTAGRRGRKVHRRK